MGQIVTILGFTGHIVFVLITQSCYCKAKESIGKNEHGGVSIKLYRWTLEFEFYVISHIMQYYSFDFFFLQSLKNVKMILSLQSIRKRQEVEW